MYYVQNRTFKLINVFILVHSVCWWHAAFPVQSQPPSAVHQSSQPNRLAQRRTSTTAYCNETQNNKEINITKYMSIHISLDHLANDPLTWSPDNADGHCLTIQPHGPLPFPQGHVPRCKPRSREARWGPAGCKDLARRRAGECDAAGSSSSLLDKHGSRLRAQRETLLSEE